MGGGNEKHEKTAKMLMKEKGVEGEKGATGKGKGIDVIWVLLKERCL